MLLTQATHAKTSAQNILTVDNSTTLRMEANLVGKAGDNAFYWIYYEITGDSCILIGSHSVYEYWF